VERPSIPAFEGTSELPFVLFQAGSYRIPTIRLFSHVATGLLTPRDQTRRADLRKGTYLDPGPDWWRKRGKSAYLIVSGIRRELLVLNRKRLEYTRQLNTGLSESSDFSEIMF